jgi:parallel beta helix pectate lyase-like protein
MRTPHNESRPEAMRLGVVAGLLIVALLLGLLAGIRLLGRSDESDGRDRGGESSATPEPTLHVSADADTPGDGSSRRPYASLKQALAEAGPGDTVAVGPGTYTGQVRSVRAGRPDAPIRLIGDDAVLAGEGVGHLLEITHDDIVVEGFELVDAGILVYVFGADRVRILDNWLHDAGGECVRLKYGASDNEIAGNRIERCGVSDFDLGEDEKNGEGIYIGTAPEQLERNPTPEPDASNGNKVHDNVVNVPAECVDIKEGAGGTLVEHNTCTGGRDPDGAGFSSRGSETVFRGNDSSGHAGAGIRLGGDRDGDGVGTTVRENRLADNAGYGLKVVRTPQSLICGNVVSGNAMGAATDDLGVDPAQPCM